MPPFRRYAVLAAALVVIFGATVFVLLGLIPAPRRETDYLVIGGVATLVSMVALSVALVTTVYPASDTFYKKRKKDE
jgi:hypothetical protein